MALKMANRRHIHKLGSLPGGYLQALVREFVLTREGNGEVLDLAIEEGADTLLGWQGKRTFFDALKKRGPNARRLLGRALSRFRRDERMLSYRFDASDCPLRYGNGGVLPVVRLDADEYFCLFYRDVFPVGWNIANGASDSEEEMLDPARIVLREYGEELFIGNHEHRLFYAFEPGDEVAPAGFRDDALKAWRRKLRKRRFARYRRLSIPTKWIEGPDTVHAAVRGRRHVSNGYFLSITLEDNAIELDRIALINLKDAENIVMFDGEYSSGYLVNRPVGLFKLARLRSGLRRREFIPDKLFFDGEKWDPDDLPDVVRRYLAQLRTGNDGAVDPAAYQKQPHKFDLCPIARAMVKRYWQWRARDQSSAAVSLRAATGPAGTPGDYDIFISYKSEDEQTAEWLHDELSGLGHRVFCSGRSLTRLGESNYARVIDEALERARVLIVLGTRPEHFDSGWVGYEWRSFLNEIRSGRKPNGQVVPFASGVSVAQLPLSLRSVQMILYTPSSPQDSFQRLCDFIGPPPDDGRARARSGTRG